MRGWAEVSDYHDNSPGLWKHGRLLGVGIRWRGALECLAEPLLDFGGLDRPRTMMVPESSMPGTIWYSGTVRAMIGATLLA